MTNDQFGSFISDINAVPLWSGVRLDSGRLYFSDRTYQLPASGGGDIALTTGATAAAILTQRKAATTTNYPALDASIYNYFNLDCDNDATLSVGTATDGALYRLVIDGNPDSDFTVTFGEGFVTNTTTQLVSAGTTTVVLYVGHDGMLFEIARSVGLTAS